MINFDDVIPVEMQHDSYYNPNPLALQHPFRCLIIGPSGSGKTNILLNIITMCSNFDKIYLYARKLEEPKYKYLINHYEIMGKRHDHEFIAYSDDIKDCILVDEVDENIQNLIIFDDMVTERNLANVSDLFVRGRKNNISIVFISQSYFDIPKIIRLNSDYYLLTKVCNKRELTEISKDHNILDFIEKYNVCMQTPYSFFMIDLKTNDPLLKCRRNFLGIWNK